MIPTNVQKSPLRQKIEFGEVDRNSRNSPSRTTEQTPLKQTVLFDSGFHKETDVGGGPAWSAAFLARYYGFLHTFWLNVIGPSATPIPFLLHREAIFSQACGT